MTEQTECKRCGTCCENGGPALHSQDLDLIEQGVLSQNDLITIRKGELIHHPATDAIQPVDTEFLKIAGKKRTWSCRFYDPEKNGCTIYTHRPIGCHVLKCWDTEEILKLAGKDLLSRLDVIKADDPLRDRVIDHESRFPVPDLKKISRTVTRSSKNTIKKLEKFCNHEVALRMESVMRWHLTVDQELFYFGRPIFELLRALRFDIVEKKNWIKLKFK